jgi:hypothetical protein
MIHCANITTPATAAARDHRASLTTATIRTERSGIVTARPSEAAPDRKAR